MGRLLQASLARMLHASFLARAMPILPRAIAFRALRAYADVITGGRLLWLSIPPTALEAADLLGRADPSARRFVPQPGGLLDLLRYAPSTDDLVLVVLDGINHAPVDSYLAPILDCYADTGRPGSRALPLFHPSTIDPNDPYADTPWLAWPANVLLAATLAEGPATLAPGADFWRVATFLSATDDSLIASDSRSRGGEGQTEHVPTAVALSCWQSARDSAAGPPAEECQELLSDLTSGGVTISLDSRYLCARFYAAVRAWPTEQPVGLDEMTRACLVAPAVLRHEQDTLRSALASHIVDQTKLASSLAMAERLFI
jgi:hypothetical protein